MFIVGFSATFNAHRDDLFHKEICIASSLSSELVQNADSVALMMYPLCLFWCFQNLRNIDGIRYLKYIWQSKTHGNWFIL